MDAEYIILSEVLKSAQDLSALFHSEKHGLTSLPAQLSSDGTQSVRAELMLIKE